MDSCKQIILLALMGLTLLASCTREPSAPERSRPSPRGAQAPAIDYPSGLADAVNACCAGFHLPRRNEVRGAWADSDGAGSVAFFVEGDFNGDGAKDAAALLVSSDGAAVELAVFEGGPGSYRLAHRRSLSRVDDLKIEAPQEIVLVLVRRGDEWAPECGDVPQTFAHSHDAIAFETRKTDAQGSVLAYAHLLYWNGKSYAEY